MDCSGKQNGYNCSTLGLFYNMQQKGDKKRVSHCIFRAKSKLVAEQILWELHVFVLSFVKNNQ